MKLLLISSSPHREKSRTFLLAKEVLRGAAAEGASQEIIHLCDLKIDFCRHCEACHKEIMHCSIKDSVPAVMEKMLECDGIILASPNYINQVTGSMKTFFDRAAHFIHCKRLLDKYIAGAVTSGSGQDKAVLDYIGFFAHTCGAQYSGGVSSAAQFGPDKEQEAYKLGNKFALDIQERRIYPEQAELIEKGRQRFREIIRLRKDEWKGEYRYWSDKGWL